MTDDEAPIAPADLRSRRWLNGALAVGLLGLWSSALLPFQEAKAASGGSESGADKKPEGDAAPPKMSPSERMARRFPQPTKVSYLIGLPMLAGDRTILGTVQTIVRNDDGGIRLIIAYGGLFGIGSRLVAVPIEVCAMAGRQIISLDMPKAGFETAPTWYGSGSTAIALGDTIRVAVTRL